MGYWPQQLNFTVWYATTGCGISREIFSDSNLQIPEQVKAFYPFHVYFTFHRILHQMGGVQNISALPDDPTLNQMDNKYNKASYKRLCAEFGVNPSTDFGFTNDSSHGLGSIYVWVTNSRP